MQKNKLIGWSDYDYVSYKDGKRKKGSTLYFVYENVDGIEGNKACEVILNPYDFENDCFRLIDINKLVSDSYYNFVYETRGMGSHQSSYLAKIEPAYTK